MSKLGKLKKDAYQAGKKRNWPEAIAIYERILEIDKSNPTLINELGDVCLKNQESTRAIAHFLSAASKYRQNGLLNNAVAIYKKILRHDAKSLNAHWYLAEIRASQGLLVEGQVHALEFLSASDDIQPDMHDIFYKRCQKLLGLFPESSEVLDRLTVVFQINNLALEQMRADVLRACLAFDAGREDEARSQIDKLLENAPELRNYAEFGQWQQRVGDEYVGPHGHDVNTIDLDGAAGVAVGGEALDDYPDDTESDADAGDGVDQLAEPIEPADEAIDPTGSFGEVDLDDGSAAAEAVETGAEDLPIAAAAPDGTTGDAAAETAAADDFGDLSFATEAVTSDHESASGDDPEAVAAEAGDQPSAESYGDDPVAQGEPADNAPAADEDAAADSDAVRDDEGCFNIGVEFGDSLDDLARAAAEAAEVVESVAEPTVIDPDSTAVEEAASSAVPEVPTPRDDASEHVDLLAEILADDRPEPAGAPTREVDTITDEIGQKVCTDTADDDPASLYNKGLVYLEMGLFEQACDCFERAANDPAEALHALEMWGIALVRSGSIAEAIKVLEGALEVPVAKAADQLGVLYQLGRAHETADHEAEARDYFERVQAVEPSFLDVGQRLATLATT